MKTLELTAVDETAAPSTGKDAPANTKQLAIAAPVDGNPVNDAEAEQEPALPDGPMWAKPFLNYMIHNRLPQDVTEARRITRRSKAFTIINGEFYKRSISQVLQRCIKQEDDKAILLDIHEGICGHHASSRTLVAKAFRVGFYWPTAMRVQKILCGAA